MLIRNTRRDFIKFAGLGLTLAPAFTLGNTLGENLPSLGRSFPDWKLSLGVASYSFREFSLTKAVEMTKRLGINRISLKNMHMPVESSPEQITAVVEEVKKSGLILYAAGVFTLDTEAELRRIFDYARKAGLKLINGVPQENHLSLLNTLVKETSIRFAIHNYGPSARRFPTPESIMGKIKGLDTRIGLCLDVGHAIRSGIDPSEVAKNYADRLFDIHLKDMTSASVDGNTIEIGHGIVDIGEFLHTLVKIKYAGTVAFEFEKDPSDPLPGLAESIGYVRGMLASF